MSRKSQYLATKTNLREVKADKHPHVHDFEWKWFWSASGLGDHEQYQCQCGATLVKDVKRPAK